VPAAQIIDQPVAAPAARQSTGLSDLNIQVPCPESNNRAGPKGPTLLLGIGSIMDTICGGGTVAARGL